MKFIQKGNKILCKNEVPIQLKKKVGALLNELMVDYSITGKDKQHEEAFKAIFKSNLFIQIDNHYHRKSDSYIKP